MQYKSNIVDFVAYKSGIGISAIHKYYMQLPNTEEAPEAPSSIDTLPPEGWADTPPVFDADSSDIIYAVELYLFTDGTFSYSNVIADDTYTIVKEISETISGVENRVDTVEKQITQKVWQTDIDTSLNTYDEEIAQSIRDRMTEVGIDVEGVNVSVKDLTSEFVTNLGSRVSDTEASLTVQSDLIASKVSSTEMESRTNSLQESIASVEESLGVLQENSVTEEQLQSAVNESVANATENISTDITVLKESYSSVEQTANDLVAKFVEQEVTVEANTNAVNRLSTIFKFSADGFVIQAENSTMSIKITNNSIIFYDGTDELASLSNGTFEFREGTIVKNLTIGGFQWQVRANGNLSLV